MWRAGWDLNPRAEGHSAAGFQVRCLQPLGHLPVNEIGGVGGDRTRDNLLAKQALSQLSYDPVIRIAMWRPRQESNLRQRD